MKKTLLGFAAIATLAIAAPALAHEGDDEAWNASSYDQMAPLDQHIREGIQHGLSDGSYTRAEARYFYRTLMNIRNRANWEQQNDEFDAQDISGRLQQLHERMHQMHEEGHERLNNDWNQSSYGNRYSYGNGYSNTYRYSYRGY